MKTNVPDDTFKVERNSRFLLSVVVPVFNEEAVIAATHGRLTDTLGRASDFDLEIIYVDDGSHDRTRAVLDQLSQWDERVRIVSFSRNFGHQQAVSAGLAYANGNAVAIIDGDLQDPPEVVIEMVAAWRSGIDVVYGVRTMRKENIAKRAAYAIFYRIYSRLADMEVPLDSGDFCLLDRRVVDVINALPEKNRFVRGLRSWAGFRQLGLRYQRQARAAGETKYSFSKLLKLAFDGIVNFSTAPLRLIFLGGVVTFMLSIIGLVAILVQRISDFAVMGVRAQDIPGWASIAFILLAFGGLQFVSIGILGEYLGRIYQEVKNRPSYVVESVRRGQNPSASGARGTVDDDIALYAAPTARTSHTGPGGSS